MPTAAFSRPIVVYRCDHLQPFRVTGTDARGFLQSQLTQDINAVSSHRAALAGFCSAQGRLWASMLLTAPSDDSGFVAVVRADIVESLLKRLRMFVLRSKVLIEPVNDQQVLGLTVAQSEVPKLSAELTHELPMDSWDSLTCPTGIWVRMPSAQEGEARFLLIAASDQCQQIIDALCENPCQIRSAESWQVLDIQAGLPWIEAKTQDLFIPQTVNLDLIQGVSFTKGCYPGQEIVARAHYRGTVKRRMHLGKIDGETAGIEAGNDVFVSDRADDPQGRVIMVASNSTDTDSGCWVLFEAPFAVIEAGDLRVGSAAGSQLNVLGLPYALTTV